MQVIGLPAVLAMNGFRRSWSMACKESLSGDPLPSPLIREYVTGHAGLAAPDRHCFKTHVLELAAECAQSVPALVLAGAERLRLENAR